MVPSDMPSIQGATQGATQGAFFLAAGQAIPASPGAYVLVIVLERALEVAWAGRGPATLPAGRYLYCGSARGPGGLKARLGRHLRRGKSVRWHVDRLTEAGLVPGAWVVPGGCECALVAALSSPRHALPHPLSHPLQGFGASDCQHCASHLLAWPDGVALPEMFPDGVGGGRPNPLCCSSSYVTGNGSEDSR